MEGSQSEGHGLIANIKAAPASPSNCTFPPAPRRPPCPELSAGTSPPPACLFLRPPPVQFSQTALTMSTPQPPAPPPTSAPTADRLWLQETRSGSLFLMCWDLASPSPARSPLCRPTGPIHAGTPRSQGTLQTPPRPSQAPLLPVGVRAQTMNKRQRRPRRIGPCRENRAETAKGPPGNGNEGSPGFPSPHFPPALETVGSQGLQPAGGPCAAVTTLRSQGQRSRKEASLRAQQPLSLALLGALSARGLLDTALPMRGLCRSQNFPQRPGEPSTAHAWTSGSFVRSLRRGRRAAGLPRQQASHLGCGQVGPKPDLGAQATDQGLTGRSGKPSPGSATEVPVLRRLFARSRLLGRPETRGLWPWVSVRLLPGRARFRQWPRWCRPERGPEPVWPGFALFLTCPRLRRCRLAPAHDSATGVRSKVCSKDPPPKLEIAASAAATRAPSRKGGRAAPAEHTQP
ncbi:uncharacterized protein [Globicephala melas]|uniref:uncharacterized protein n=1 Tax=Globicephala melas TaxID=9731 RepID=UPI0038736F92